MSLSVIQCAGCSIDCIKNNSAINRAYKIGAPLYCSKACAGRWRRTGKTVEQKKTEKRTYDQQYRANNLERIKIEKAARFKATYDPVAAAIERKAKAPQHAEYCRRPEYVAWKRVYDEKYRAKKLYGEFWQCFLIVASIEKEVSERASKTDIAVANSTLNKAQTRRRNYERTYGNQS